MAYQPKERRIRVRGKQRDDIDIDLLMQAILMIADEQTQRLPRDGGTSGETVSEDGR